MDKKKPIEISHSYSTKCLNLLQIQMLLSNFTLVFVNKITINKKTRITDDSRFIRIYNLRIKEFSARFD